MTTGEAESKQSSPRSRAQVMRAEPSEMPLEEPRTGGWLLSDLLERSCQEFRCLGPVLNIFFLILLQKEQVLVSFV